MKHPTTPCSSCPYRKDTKTHHWSKLEFEDVLKNENTQYGTVYACHKHKELSNSERGFCAGWLLDQKKRNLPSIMLRLELIKSEDAVKALNVVTDGGHEMYSTIKQMCRANGVRPIERNVRMPKKETLTPADLDQCQAEIRQGSFMTLGPRSWERCKAVPTVVVMEMKPPKGSDVRGSMSVCDSCKKVLIEKYGADYFTEKPIKAKRGV